MALTISLDLDTATWGDLRAYVELNRQLEDSEPIGHSVHGPQGEIEPALYQEIRRG